MADKRKEELWAEPTIRKFQIVRSLEKLRANCRLIHREFSLKPLLVTVCDLKADDFELGGQP